jgi:Uma2 family endonuclease
MPCRVARATNGTGLARLESVPHPRPMKALLSDRVTEAEFLSWPESTARLELIDGFVVRQPAASYGHQEALSRLVFQLRTWARGRRVTVGQSPCDIRFAPNRILQPDAFVILDSTPFGHQGPLTRIPELCIEVLSCDALHDRVTKRLIYAEAGVQELWLLDLSGLIERWTGPGLLQAETLSTVVSSPLLEGLELDIKALVAEG